ncbi:MAG: porin [Desulfuromonadales bacterium]|nr:porin [Desulfuromonadales bacterium]
MKQSYIWLLALLSILTLAATSTLAIAEEDSAHLSGNIEVGATAVDIKDNPARVNEYAPYRSDDGLGLAPSLDLEYLNNGIWIEAEVDIKGRRDQNYGFKSDFNRFLRLDLNYQVFEHWKDHETLDQMGATLAGDTGGGQPNVTTDKIYADLYDLGITTVGGQDPINGTYDPAIAYTLELNNDYIIKRSELKNEMDLALPFLPNVVFHAGIRIEEREGMEQAIGLSKCAGCHVSAEGKDIDERTEDLTFGITGKFGLVTVEYEYLDRTFDEDADNPSRYYSLNDKFDQLLYKGSELEYSRTPDSEKETHSLKVRADLARNTSIVGSYVKSDIESSKSNLTDAGYELLGKTTLETEYESFGTKLSTRIGDNLRLSLRGSTYEIETNDVVLTFADRAAYIAAFPGGSIADLGIEDDWHSAEEREVTELGIDAVYRLAKATTLRLGYEYEEVDRVEEELGVTETHTLKAAIRSRINKTLSGSLSYEYQDIDDPFGGDDVTGIYQETGTLDVVNPDSGLYFAILSGKNFYWDTVYPERTLDATNQPDMVNEIKFKTTWAPSANMAATLFARVRYEENDDVKYEQTTYAPGVSFWYAPNNKLNLTMSYNFNKQETENQMCVGWYHG